MSLPRISEFPGSTSFRSAEPVASPAATPRRPRARPPASRLRPPAPRRSASRPRCSPTCGSSIRRRARPGFRGVAVTRDGRVWSPATRELRQVSRRRRGSRPRRAQPARRARGRGRDGHAGRTGRAGRRRGRAGEGRRGGRRARRHRPRGSRRRPRPRRGRRGRAPRALGDPAAALRARRGPERGSPRAGRIGDRDREAPGGARRTQRGRARPPPRPRASPPPPGRAAPPLAERLASRPARRREALATRVEAIGAELDADQAAGEKLAAGLRECAAEESRVHPALKERDEAVTRGEVHAQRARDHVSGRGGGAQPLWRPSSGSTRSPPRHRCRSGERALLKTRIERLHAAASSSARSTRWRSRSTRKRSSTSTSSKAQRHDLEAALRELQTS